MLDTLIADSIRRQILKAMEEPCSCGECPSDDDFRAMLSLSDADLVQAALDAL